MQFKHSRQQAGGDAGQGCWFAGKSSSTFSLNYMRKFQVLKATMNQTPENDKEISGVREKVQIRSPIWQEFPHDMQLFRAPIFLTTVLKKAVPKGGRKEKDGVTRTSRW